MPTTTGLFKSETGGRELAAGEIIFGAGDPADHLYVVQEGHVEIKVGDRVVETVGPGGIFGEMAMIDGSQRSATATASDEATVLPIDKTRFDFLITQTPHFARMVMAILVERLRASNPSCT